MDAPTLGYKDVDLRAVAHIVKAGQVRAIAQAIIYAQQYSFDGVRSLNQIINCVMEDIN